MQHQFFTPGLRLVGVFFGLSVLGAALFLGGAWHNQAWTHWFVLWNLVLAWIPFMLALLLRWKLKTDRWSHGLPLILTFVWLMFLPNTFYMITDFIHLYDVPRRDYIYDTATFSVLIGTGAALGFASLAVVHDELRRRLPTLSAWRVIGGVLLLSSFAIYVGRFLRWNTWDILVHPAGMLFDISEIVLDPFGHPQMFITTLSFFVALSTVHAVLRYGIQRPPKSEV